MSEVLILSRRETRPSFDIFVVCSTLILSEGWWHGISSIYLVLFKGKRRRGEHLQSKPRGASHHAAFVFALST